MKGGEEMGVPRKEWLKSLAFGIVLALICFYFIFSHGAGIARMPKHKSMMPEFTGAIQHAILVYPKGGEDIEPISI